MDTLYNCSKNIDKAENSCLRKRGRMGKNAVLIANAIDTAANSKPFLAILSSS